MDGLTIELTNVCNRRCLHCIRNKVDPPAHFPLDLAAGVLAQARTLGLQTICLTGGEVALYPHLEAFLTLVVSHGFKFNLVTNGYQFQERLLPLLRAPRIREHLTEVCLSLDGAKAASHDALRGPGSFREVVEAAALCKLSGIRLSLKSVITNFNKEELTDLALLGASLEARDHGFLHPFPSPRLIREGVIPDPDELRELVHYVMASLAKALKPRISVEGYLSPRVLFTCSNIQEVANLDYLGNLVLCCNLSHTTQEEGEPSRFGREWLGHLGEISLSEGLVRHFQGVAALMAARLRDRDNLAGLTFLPCYWCFRHFGKLDWLRDYPHSPWSAGMGSDK